MSLMSASALAQDAAPEPTDDTAPSTDYRPGRFVRPDALASRVAEAVDADATGFSATYRDADAAFVVNQILGEFLKVDYSIAPDVDGTVTLRVSDVRTRAQALAALRSALAPLGVAVIDRGDFIAVVRGAGRPGEAAGEVVVLAPGEAAPTGTGAAVMTPRHITPSQLERLIAPFAPDGTVALADDARRVLILRGEETAITAASQAAALFDVDWFSQVSTGVFALEHVAPEDVAGELRPLLGAHSASVELVPVPRLASLVVMARSPEALRVAETWIARLDVSPVRTATKGLLIYDARYADAEALLATVQRLVSAAPAAAPPASYAAPPDDETGGSPPYGGGYPASAAVPDLYLAADPDQNAVIARGKPERVEEVRALLEALDRPRAQVLIEAAIVEVTLNDELRYGVNWSGIEDERLTATFSDAPDGAVASRFPGFSVSYVNVDIEAAINLLASVTSIEIVSRPSVIALHNETAELQIGDQVPIVTQSAVSVLDPGAPIVNQTTYRDTGVILRVTPRVRAGGAVEIEVAQEVSEVARTTTSGIDSPTITQRRIESTLLVPSGEAVALGGLISTNRTKGETGVPILKDAPLFGALFRTNTNVVERTELIIFLTPKVLVTPRDAADATAELRAAMARLEAVVERSP